MKKIILLIAVAFLSMGVDDCRGPMPNYDCARGFSFYHKLAPGEDFQCPKEYRQEQVWEDKGLGFSRGPSDMTECICIPKYY